MHINELCNEFKIYVDEASLDEALLVKDEEIVGQIQTSIGKGQLLINQKFKQFRGLCDKNIVCICFLVERIFSILLFLFVVN